MFKETKMYSKAHWGMFIVLLALTTACGVQADKVQKINQYFDLETLVRDQINILSTNKVTVRKEMELDGQKEIVQIKADSTLLTKEFQFWINANINKPANTDVFQILERIENGFEVTAYIPKNEAEQSVKLMEIFREGSTLKKIEILFEEENSIYFSERRLSMTFGASGILTEYMVKGYQKMILKTPVSYQIRGIISEI